MSPSDYTGLWKLFYDWQTIFAGAMAILAAIIGAGAAYYVGHIQMAAAKEKDRSQARCLAVAVLPELLQLKMRHDRATKIVSEEFPRAKREHWATVGTVSLILSAQVELTPFLDRTVGELYILERAGPTLLQLVAVTLQYNNLIRTLAQQIRDNVNSFNPPEHKQHLCGQLQVIEQDIVEAERLIGPIHDEATVSCQNTKFP
jgi:hypothetical protein